MFIAGNTAVENARSLSQSALPDAPQHPHEPRSGSTLRGHVVAALRTTAKHELRLANRLDPHCKPLTN